MTTKVIDLDPEDCNQESAQCHLMPCRIDYSGSSVKAKEYFWPTIKELKAGSDDEQGRDKKYPNSCKNDDSNNPILTASFRGRPLQGRKIQLPADYKGYILDKDSQSSSSSTSAGSTVKRSAEKTFEEFTYWNWDELPNRNDTVAKALQWINVSKAIHVYFE